MKTENHLDGAFGHAAPEHYIWQTEHPYVATRERALVRAAFEPLGARVLDVGCGEGATLRNLGEPIGATGVDLFEEKIAFARERMPRCRFVVGSAYELPFADGEFDHLIVRDLIHHLDEPERFVRECARVLTPGGRLDVLEPSRGNPLIATHALLLPVERGELRSTMRYMSRLVESRFQIVATGRFQPMPIHRIVFHPDLGYPMWAQQAPVASAVDALERVAGRLLPRAMWAYLHVRAVR
jgi:SAM-dependent methyltransferase